MPRPHLKACHFTPLVGFVILTVAVGYGLVIPGSCIAGWNELSMGFASVIAGACLSYWMGLRVVLRDAGEAE